MQTRENTQKNLNDKISKMHFESPVCEALVKLVAPIKFVSEVQSHHNKHMCDDSISRQDRLFDLNDFANQEIYSKPSILDDIQNRAVRGAVSYVCTSPILREIVGVEKLGIVEPKPKSWIARQVDTIKSATFAYVALAAGVVVGVAAVGAVTYLIANDFLTAEQIIEGLKIVFGKA